MTKKKLQDPRVFDGQMMEPVLTPNKRSVFDVVNGSVCAKKLDRIAKKHIVPKIMPDLVVTISGKTGAGKTTLARLIYNTMASLTRPGGNYRVSLGDSTHQNFAPGTGIESRGDFRTVLIVESEE